MKRYLEKQCRCENRNIEVGEAAEFAIEEEGARSENFIIISEAIGEDSERQFHGVRNVTNF